MSQCVESILGISSQFWAEELCWASSSECWQAARVQLPPSPAPGNSQHGDVSCPHGHIPTCSAAPWCPLPSKMQQELCLKDDRAHLRFPIEVGTNTWAGRWLHRSLLTQGPSSPLKWQNRERAADIQGPQRHCRTVFPSFSSPFLLSWMCLCVYGGGYQRAKVWVKGWESTLLNLMISEFFSNLSDAVIHLLSCVRVYQKGVLFSTFCCLPFIYW